MESFGDVLFIAQATAQPNKDSSAQWNRDRWQWPIPETRQAGRRRLATPLYRLPEGISLRYPSKRGRVNRRSSAAVRRTQ
jgi:hypothetical protein